MLNEIYHFYTYKAHIHFQVLFQIHFDLISQLFDNQNSYREENSTMGDQNGLYADIKKIKEEIGWEPQTELENGLAKMIKSYYYKKNF